MPQIINTNISSINAQRNLNRSQGALQTSLERLSSGLRINSAKDDAAGLAISNRFQTQVRGLNVAVRNANDGISFAQTTESALTEISTALQRMRDLAVQSANDTNSDSDRISLQAEVDQLVAEINRIAKTTTFNNRPVLDGSNTTLSFHVGANANQTVEVTGVDARASSLGSQPGIVQSTGDRAFLGATDVIGAGTGAQGIQEATGVAAGAVTITDFTVQLASVASGINIADAAYGGTITSAATTQLQDRTHDSYGSGMAKQVAERINAIRVSGEETLQGVYASATTTFRGSDPRDSDYTGSVDLTANTNVGQGQIQNGDLNINGVDIGPTSFQVNDADGSLVSAINAKSDVTGVTASVDRNGELVLTAEDGRDIVITTASAAVTNDLFGGGDEASTTRFSGAAFTDLRVTGRLTVTGTDTIDFLGADEADVGTDDLTVEGAEDNVQAVGTIANADITTVEGANTLINSVDSALDQINSIRGQLGAIQNRFESTIRNLSSISESLAAANSRILDADFAAETAKLAKNQVLQQAGISVLAQANALPQQVLSLLQG